MDILETTPTNKITITALETITQRIDAIHKQLHMARLTKNYDQQYNLLTCLWLELSRVANTPEEYDTHETHRLKVREAYFQIRKLINQKKIIPAQFMETFYQWELALTRFEQKINLGLPKS